MRFFRWAVFCSALRAAWPVWFLCLGFVVAFALAWAGLHLARTAELGDGWRYAGNWLQLFGLLAAGKGLLELREHFKLPTPCSVVATWFRQLRSAFGPPGPPIRIATSGDLVRSVRCGHSRLRPAPDATVPERLAALEAHVNLLQIEQEALVDTHDSKIAALDEKVQDETRQREIGDAKVSRDVTVVGVGGFPLAFVGLVWLLFGVILTSIPSQLAAGLRALRHLA